MHHPFVLFRFRDAHIHKCYLASARSRRRCDFRSGRGGKQRGRETPRLKAAENTVRRDGLRCSTRNSDNFFFSTGCAFRPASYEYGNARRRRAARPTFCCIHLFRQVQSYACGFVVITLATRGYIVALCPRRAAARPPFYTRYYFITEDSQRWYYHIT